jgi:hypothetical protein
MHAEMNVDLHMKHMFKLTGYVHDSAIFIKILNYKIS